jgi:hypothetical protein
MPVSQNGWKAGDEALMKSHTIPGTDIALRVYDGHVATIMMYVAGEINKIEKLNPKKTQWCWGYAYRPIRGQSVGLSNHASGTAIDLNAPNHPRGKRGTWGVVKKARIRKVLKPLKAVIRWGEDYVSAPCDGMHFEIIGNAKQVAEAAAWVEQQQEKQEVAVTTAIMQKIATYVLKTGIVNRNTGKVMSTAWFLQDIEDTQDKQGALLAQLVEQIKAQGEALEEVRKNTAPKATA